MKHQWIGCLALVPCKIPVNIRFSVRSLFWLPPLHPVGEGDSHALGLLGWLNTEHKAPEKEHQPSQPREGECPHPAGPQNVTL